MSITPGTLIGPYEVISPLGQGGMGVVYRARDTKLGREVALKLLPDYFAKDSDRLFRFQREAQILASLNHPNISQIYGLEPSAGGGCIVMEMVEGETLADRLKRGPIPLEEALQIARQVAAALGAAHERDIVHRDLKPGNIKRTPDGKVKVLDFGLAKAVGARDSGADLADSPTAMSASTPGIVMGTAPYMSPEQARGKPVDARTDIWAFGCVLFEMLTARQVFEGETSADSIAKILAGQPNWELLPADTPPAVRMLLSAALTKDPKQRPQHAGDMRLLLDPSVTFTSAVAASTLPPVKRRWPIVAAAALAMVSVAVVAVLILNRAPLIERREQISATGIVNGYPVSISPNGKRIAYVAATNGGGRAVWVKLIGASEPQQLAGTDGVTGGPFWSPDSKYLAFAADGQLKKIDASGGAAQKLAEIPGAVRTGTWSDSGVILVGRGSDGLIVRVPDSSGEPVPVTTLDASRQETFHFSPKFLPDGNHFLYVANSSTPGNGALFVGSLDSKTATRVMPLRGPASYAAPYLLFLNNGALTAQFFDPKRFTTSGNPVTIAENVTNFAASDNGALIYRTGTDAGSSGVDGLQWFDRGGIPMGQPFQVPGGADYLEVEISPDGHRAAVSVLVNGNRDIWVIDLDRRAPKRLTTDAANDRSPVWSADGSLIAFLSDRDGHNQVYQISTTGTGTEKRMVVSNFPDSPTGASRDRRFLIFSRQIDGGTELMSLPFAGGEAKIALRTQFAMRQARPSPDGRWLAYRVAEGSVAQIVVQPFPDAAAAKETVSTEGGTEPKWSGDGSELYYLDFGGRMMVVPIKGDRFFEPGQPAELFQTARRFTDPAAPTVNRFYDVDANGQRFLMIVSGGSSSGPITAIINWTSGLPKR